MIAAAAQEQSSLLNSNVHTIVSRLPMLGTFGADDA
jgi:hypothetical protein